MDEREAILIAHEAGGHVDEDHHDCPRCDEFEALLKRTTERYQVALEKLADL